MTRRKDTRAVVFDLDGTLVDTMTSAPQAYVDTIRSLGGSEVSVGEVVAAWHMGPTPVVLAHFLGRAISADDLARFYGCFEAAIATARPFPGVTEMIDVLSQDGYRLGVFTAATRRAATLMLAASGLDGRFGAIVGGDEVSEPKPAPLGLQLACRMMGVAASETAYVGDADVDIQCAEAAGALGVRACWGAQAATVNLPGPAARHPDDVVRLLRQGRRPRRQGPVV